MTPRFDINAEENEGRKLAVSLNVDKSPLCVLRRRRLQLFAVPLVDNQENPRHYVIAQQYARVIAKASRRDAPVVLHDARPP